MSDEKEDSKVATFDWLPEGTEPLAGKNFFLNNFLFSQMVNMTPLSWELV